MKEISAWIDEVNSVTVQELDPDYINKEDLVITASGKNFSIVTVDFIHTKKVKIILDDTLPLGEEAYLISKDLKLPIYPRNIVKTAWFDQTFDATADMLGSTYESEQSSFSVWAPTATKVNLMLRDRSFPMKRKSNGVWKTTVNGNWNGASYHFDVTVNGEERSVNDPYAKSMTANSERSVVLDPQAMESDIFQSIDYPKVDKQNASIYELHIRDATISEDSGVYHKGKFLGLTELNTVNARGYPTGLSYLKELGCTHVQLLPIQDFARVDENNSEKDYNWGYDPLYYFAPEGSYATTVDNPYSRIKECKQMIQSFHEQQLSVILDVVFNHVYKQEESCFERLVPGYYFRYRKDGSLSNGTGTGNDLATERRMVRKFILDCVDYWLSQYHVDGFRFDLMGAIDLETMQLIRKRCNEEERPILLLGEGWDLDTELKNEQKTTIAQANQLVDVSFFNDKFRDSLKGNLFATDAKGFINGNGHFLERLPQIVAGSCDDRFGDKLFTTPLQSVNYVECHDNHTLWDRLLLSNPKATTLDRKRMHQLATGFTILSQGIPFIHAGQEFYRTKHGDENSYISGDDINQIDWHQRGIENEYVKWVQSLLALRKKYWLFRLDSALEIENRLHIMLTPHPVFGYMLMGDQEDFAIFVNPTNEEMQIEMPAHGRWEKLLSNYSAFTPISCLNQTKTKILAYELLVWKKTRV